MMNISDLTQEEAAHIVHRMGESGQPPEYRALAVNVGTGDVLAVLRDEYLLPIKEAGRNSSFKLVQAPFGGGKTQFLRCLRELAQAEGFCTALVGVSPRECPFDDAAQIYQAVARSIECPVPEQPGARPETGLPNLLRTVAADRMARYGREPFREWVLKDLARATVECTSLLRAATCFLDAFITGDLDSEEILGDYLLGEVSSLSEVARFRIRELPDNEKGFRFLRALAQVVRHLELPGLVLLFDEMDRTMSMARKRKRSIGDNLRQMIDHCGQAVFPAVLLVYSVPPEFMTQVVSEYPALEQRLKHAGALGRSSPLAPVIDLDQLPLAHRELFVQIGTNLLALYQHGYGVDLDDGVQRGNLAALAGAMAEDILESSSRRAFVKAAVALLSDQHRTGVRNLTEGEVEKLCRSARLEERMLMDGEREL